MTNEGLPVGAQFGYRDTRPLPQSDCTSLSGGGPGTWSIGGGGVRVTFQRKLTCALTRTTVEVRM